MAHDIKGDLFVDRRISAGVAISIPSWVTTKDYLIDDMIISGSVIYVCIVAHTSSTFATDLDVPNWLSIGGEKTNKFADDTTLAPFTAGAPTDAEIEAYSLSQSPDYLDTFIYYTGTDVDSDPVVYAWYLDSEGSSLLTTKPDADKYVSNFIIASFTAGTLPTITAAVHLKGTTPNVKVYSGTGPFIEVWVDSVSIGTTGDIIVSVPSGDEFDGRLIIS